MQLIQQFFFWKTVKSLFGNKVKKKNKARLLGKNNLITHGKTFAKTYDRLLLMFLLVLALITKLTFQMMIIV